MGLRCSLLGHTFDETDREEEREDRGSEVVTVVRELERCSRCGAERIVSENKEVTSVVDAEEVGVEGDADAGRRDGPPPERGAGRPDDGAPGGVPSFDDEAFEGVGDPEEEDAEILTDSSEPRDPGQWPEDDADWEPDAPTDAGDPDAEGPDDPTGSAGDDILDAEDGDGEGGTAFDPTRSSTTVPEGAYECPECGFVVDADSSFRAGDACPECQQGYLEERNR